MTELASLIERLERSVEPLGKGGVAMVIAALKGTRVQRFTMHIGDGGEDEMTIAFSDGNMGNFSENMWPDRSLDGAMSFVPYDHTVYLTRPNQTLPYDVGRLCYACVAPKGMGGPQFARRRAHLSAHHASLPVALAIAILKARSVA